VPGSIMEIFLVIVGVCLLHFIPGDHCSITQNAAQFPLHPLYMWLEFCIHSHGWILSAKSPSSFPSRYALMSLVSSSDLID
jgi:hypothetical protein